MAEDKKTTKKTANGIRVRTAQTGFRRGGREWYGTTEVLFSELSKEQLAQIRNEPLLVVEDIVIDIATAADDAAE